MARSLTQREEYDYVSMRDRAPEFLGDLMDHITEVLTEGGVARERAELFGLATALRLRQRWAKQLIYFAEGRAMDLGSRNKRILDEFDGRNFDELAARYGVSIVWVRRIIEASKSERSTADQGSLDL